MLDDSTCFVFGLVIMGLVALISVVANWLRW